MEPEKINFLVDNTNRVKSIRTISSSGNHESSNAQQGSAKQRNIAITYVLSHQMLFEYHFSLCSLTICSLTILQLHYTVYTHPNVCC